MSRHVINLTAGTIDSRINEIKAAIETYASEFLTVESDTGTNTTRFVKFTTAQGRKLALQYYAPNQIWLYQRNIADTGTATSVSFLSQTNISVNTQIMYIAKNEDSCVINWIITNSGNTLDNALFIGKISGTANYIMATTGSNIIWSQYNLTDDTSVVNPLNDIPVPTVWNRKTETEKQIILPLFAHSLDKATLYDAPVSKVFIFPNVEGITACNEVTINGKNYHLFGRLATSKFLGLIEV